MHRNWAAALLVGSALGLSLPALAQDAQPSPVATPEAAPAAAPAAMAEQSGTVRSITIRGAERLEPETVRSYVGLTAGDTYDRNRLDRALKDLYATELFADVTIRDREGELIVDVRENPVVNRIVLEGNKRLKDDKFKDEIKLSPRQIFTRTKARADVARILELYRRQGRFAAAVDPKIVQLDQNRVDVVFEIEEGPKSKVRRINIVGNTKFSDGELRGEMATKEAKWYKFFTSNDTYDPDRSAFDQQKLRQFYLTQGYADFRVVSSVAELTPDRKDFLITYVVDEGERYKFGEVDLESQIRDIKEENFKRMLPMKQGDWYNAKEIEDTVTNLSESVGLLGYAFADINPRFNRDKEKREMGVTFVINETPRVYVERVEINGNTITKDHVIRREFRLAEGDAFNSFRVKRSRDRIQSLGYFQENLEIQQKQGSGPDKVILEANLEEQATGELQVSAGYSSLENFLVNLSIRQRNFRGMGQELRASVNWSKYSQSAEIGFTEPYLFGRNLALGGDIFRRDYNSFRFLGNGDRDTTYEQSTTGFQIRTGFPITEFWSASFRYGLSYDDVSLDESTFYTNGICDPLRAGRFLCDAVGKRTTSSIGYSIAYDTRDNAIRPSRGHRFMISQDIAGVGGSVQYVRSRLNADKYWRLFGSGFIFNLGLEAGQIFGWGGDNIRLTDRFFLGEPRMRGFDIRGVGPRVIRQSYTNPTNSPDPLDYILSSESNQRQDDSIGGETYYQVRAEVQIPLSAGAAEMGLRPSVFVDVGALWHTDFNPATDLQDIRQISTGGVDANGDPEFAPGFKEFYYGDTWKPRVAVGFGINWNSPFGPFRIDIAKALVKQEGDDTKLFQFNVGTQF
ncbi:outer membrane protein assembly factor BamA [Sphingosinicella soli]|uniref:Outer membrane protein assembly factor BamA n=1 Tax=Sphingosinicella soli TaxID=333708 RepID=A0A7W7F5D2_9SPHN|nr:outer membrane protein assembly factor BamA [Sphingosinicella soli]MBB4630574.1 outer membrane protein insertion porin family [Sphingosinicella soli]